MVEGGNQSRRSFVDVPVLLTAVLGLAVTGVVVGMTVRMSSMRSESDFRRLASLRFGAIQSTINLHVTELEATRALFHASGFVNREEFRVFVEPILRRRRGIRAIEHVRRVPHEDRESAEKSVRQELQGYADFCFVEMGPEGALRVAGDRAEYYPVFYVEPMADNERAFGFDLASNPARRSALVQAGATDGIVASEPVRLVQEEGQFGALVFVPTYDFSVVGASRMDSLSGFVLGVFDVEGILAEALEYFDPGLVHVSITDGETSLTPEVAGLTGLTNPEYEVEEGIAIGGRSWTVRCVAAPGFEAHRGTLLPGLAAVIGLALTALIAAYVHMLRRRTEYEHALALEERRHQQRLRLIMRELDHRVKNNLATVLSLAEQSAEVSDSLEQFRQSFSGRIRSMAHTHQALAAEKWEGVQMPEIARLVLGPYSRSESGRVRMYGDPLMLSAEWSSGLCMTLHELATNAAKYGALSVPDGLVDLRWKCESNNLMIDWVESGGPTVEKPKDVGFGTRFLRGVIEYELGGTVVLDYHPDGFRCKIAIPLGDLTTSVSETERAGGAKN